MEIKRDLNMEKEIEEIYTLISEVSKLSELQYLKESQNREPHQEEIDKTITEMNKIIQSSGQSREGVTVD